MAEEPLHNTTINSVFCENSTTMVFKHFASYYGPIHQPLCLIICPIGVITNILNVIVLNQPSMKSPTNTLLTYLAISDGIIMALYIVFDAYFLIHGGISHAPLLWTWYLLFYVIFQNFLHAFSSWVIVTLGVFRLIYIRYPQIASTWCNFFRAKLSCGFMIIGSVIITIPYGIAHTIVRWHPPKSSVKPTEDASPIKYSPDALEKEVTFLTVATSRPIEVDRSQEEVHYTVDYVDDQVRLKIMFWNSAFCVKMLPIVLMTVLSVLLISALRSSERRHRKLKGLDKTTAREEGENARRTIKTTRMLLGVVIIFMLTYLPQSALLVMNGFIDNSAGECFSKYIYDPLGDLMDLLTLINNGVNFILYCSMSKQFRDTFVCLFVTRFPCFGNTIEDNSVQGRRPSAVPAPIHLREKSNGGRKFSLLSTNGEQEPVVVMNLKPQEEDSDESISPQLRGSFFQEEQEHMLYADADDVNFIDEYHNVTSSV